MLDQLMGTQRNGQIFCEKSDSMRWYVIFLIHKSLFPGIEEEIFLLQSKIQSTKGTLLFLGIDEKGTVI